MATLQPTTYGEKSLAYTTYAGHPALVVIPSNPCDGEPALTEGYKASGEWADGDLRIISTDRVVFRTYSSHLFAASPVFRGAGEANAGCTLTVYFLDTGGIENSAVISLFLDFLVHGTAGFSEPKRSGKMYDFAQLAQFLRKYACTPLLQQLCRWTQIHCLPLVAFIVAAIADDADACAEAIKKTCRVPCCRPNPGERGPILGTILNPLLLPFELYNVIPSRYRWALIRAWGIVGNSEQLHCRFTCYLDKAKNTDINHEENFVP